MIADRLDALLRVNPLHFMQVAPERSVTAERKKRKKRKNKGKNKKAQENIFVRCQTQVDPCVTFFDNACGDEPFCDALVACCDSLATCDIAGFLICVNTPA